MSREGIERALDSGFELVQMARALVNDPAFVNKLREGDAATRSECDHRNYCIARMYSVDMKCCKHCGDLPRKSGRNWQNYRNDTQGNDRKGSRTALVTGAGSGIGRCMARRLAELGYRLILAGLDPAKLEAAAEELHEQYGLAVEVIPIDLARPEAAHELFERVQALGREVDVLVNNAGAFSFRDILQTPVERIERILCLHALTTTLTCRLFGTEMARRGCGGHILNMASYSLWMPWPGLALYSASKSYLRGFR